MNPRPLKSPTAFFKIDEHYLKGVLQAGEAILAHDFTQDLYSAITRHASLGHGVVASFSRFHQPDFITIGLPGVSLHYTVPKFQDAMAQMKQDDLDLTQQRAAHAGPIVESMGASVVGAAFEPGGTAV